MRFYFTDYTIGNGVLFLWMFYSEGITNFQTISFANRDILKPSLTNLLGRYGALIKVLTRTWNQEHEHDTQLNVVLQNIQVNFYIII